MPKVMVLVALLSIIGAHDARSDVLITVDKSSHCDRGGPFKTTDPDDFARRQSISLSVAGILGVQVVRNASRS